ncbi:hypothetical protein M427DRAFT_142051 [Gonapodya prolifera JEL478]|uniref:Uncharacterized protein n=1 Tax=Gonapodya prolifera (strain JEL478) TaxID=1344416 RepID=A0A139AYB3_GONPJ|nr:hypothetical protein M427DRAFT_142051 [Gonapodya prolifera JEL478]|eukprot:KXS21563.1 hypothetical protein M427DRAFT_142051 [Gonapodya prolifera JEL478]
MSCTSCFNLHFIIFKAKAELSGTREQFKNMEGRLATMATMQTDLVIVQRQRDENAAALSYMSFHKTEVATLRQELAKLEEEKWNLRGRKVASDRRVLELSARVTEVDEMEQEISQLKSRVGELESVVKEKKELEEELLGVKERLDELNDCITDRDARAQELKGEQAEVKREMEEAKQALESSHGECGRLLQLVEAQKQRIVNLELQLAQQGTIVMQLKQAYENAEAQRAVLAARTESDKSEHERKIRSLFEDVEIAQTSAMSAAKTVDAQNHRIEALCAERDHLNRTIAKLREEQARFQDVGSSHLTLSAHDPLRRSPPSTISPWNRSDLEMQLDGGSDVSSPQFGASVGTSTTTPSPRFDQGRIGSGVQGVHAFLRQPPLASLAGSPRVFDASKNEISDDWAKREEDTTSSRQSPRSENSFATPQSQAQHSSVHFIASLRLMEGVSVKIPVFHNVSIQVFEGRLNELRYKKLPADIRVGRQLEDWEVEKIKDAVASVKNGDPRRAF